MMEVPGEDTLAAGEYGAHFVRSMQARSPDGTHQRVVCAPKHWLDYDLEGRKDAYVNFTFTHSVCPEL